MLCCQDGMDEEEAGRTTASDKLMKKAFLSLIRARSSKLESIIHANNRPKIGKDYPTPKRELGVRTRCHCKEAFR